ncbi:hypothetical protein OEA41_010133 [Lepraria neglecta]|uniref:Uncharacterized protein n=1 Tax=Lepraria neglecta TaxID=209136 RepID=A0AAE0DHF5_9LECA|nr:hypothetical protein OEA41_010133 [Lepraria neglecta]
MTSTTGSSIGKRISKSTIIRGPSTPNSKPTSGAWNDQANNGADYEWKEKKRESDYGAGWSWYRETKTSVNNTVKWHKASNTMRLESKILMNKHESNSILDHNNVSDIDAKATYAMTLTLNTIVTGGLEVVVTQDMPQCGCTFSATEYAWTPSLNERFGEKLKAGMQTSISYDDLQKSLTTALNGQSQFVFAGGGVFEMKNPVFSKGGDLLVELAYVSEPFEVDSGA